MVAGKQFPVAAQSMIVAPDGTGTLITQDGQTYHIHGGTQAGINLFHSFQAFGLSHGEIANFLSHPSIVNILGRVTGGDPSVINGLIQVTGANSNLYLMNPAGFVLGSGASLNVNGDFFATTADAIALESGWFNALGDNDYATLIGAPNQFAFLRENPGEILNFANLITAGNIHLSGGMVFNQGEIISTSGNVTLAAIPGTRLVNLSQPGMLLSLELPDEAVTNGLNPLTLPELLTGNPLPSDRSAGILPASENAGNVAINGAIQGENIDLYAANQVTVENPDLIDGNTRVIRFSETGENPDQAVFIDARVDNPETLLLGGAPGTVTQIINPDENGVSVISEQLGAISDAVGDLASVAIVAEGNAGNFWLGNQWVNSGNLGQYRTDLQTWGNALTENADLLLYSCFTALGATGEALLTQLANATGADVAASTNVTGSANFNGDWELEAQTGTIETDNPFNAETLANWDGKLAILTVESIADEVVNDGILTLREAILAANTNNQVDGQAGEVGEDTIVFDTTGIFATPQTITLGSDLDTITDDLIITGPGEANLTIDRNGGGNANTKIFNAETENFTVEQLTLQNAGTGIFQHSIAGALTVNHVTITDMSKFGIERRATPTFGAANYWDIYYNPSPFSRVTLNHVNLQNNFGGIYNEAATLEIHHSRVTDIGGRGAIDHQPWYGADYRSTPPGVVIQPKPIDTVARLHITDSAIAHNSDTVVSSARGDVVIERTEITDNEFFFTGAGLFIDHDDRDQSRANVTITDSLIARNSGSLYGSGMTVWGDAVNVTLNRTPFVGNEGGIFTSMGGRVTEGHDDIQFIGDDISFAIADSVGDVNLDLGGATDDFTINSRGAINLNNSLLVDGDLTLIANGDINTRNLTTTGFGGDGGDVTVISRQGSINTQSGGAMGAIDARSFLGNGGQVTLRAAGAIVTGAINTEASTGAGGRVAIQSDDYVRINGTVDSSFVTFPASISTAGATRGGNIQIHHGGQGIIPFIVGDAGLNGTSGAITAGNGLTIATTQRFPLEHRQPGMVITPGPMNTLNTDFLSFIAGANPVRPLNILDFVESVARQMGATSSASYGDRQSILIQGNQQTVLSTTRNFADFGFGLPGEKVGLSDGAIVAALQNLDRFMSASFVSDSFEDAAGEIATAEDDTQSDDSEKTESIANIHETFQRITEQTGTVPAIVYAIAQPNFLELIVITPDNQLRREVIPEADRDTLRRTIAQFRRSIKDVRDDYLAPAQQLYDWLIRPIAAQIEALNVDNLVFSMGEELRALPLAALHDGEQFLVEKYSLGQIPSLSLTNSNYQPLQNAHVLAMGASEFNTLEPLPAVPGELAIIQNVNPSKIYFNEGFTWDNLYTESNQRRFEIVHLATHAQFLPGSAHEAYIQLWDDEQITINRLRELHWYDAPQVELLILSACQTALDDPQAELGFAGLAVQAGVKSVLASLWKISDVGTLQLINGFYAQLNDPAITTKAEALRQAQIAMIQGDFANLEKGAIAPNLPSDLWTSTRSSALSHPYYWSGFMLVGSPW